MVLDSIELCKITANPTNPREDFSDDDKLYKSIGSIDMKVPIIIRPVSGDDKVDSGIEYIVVDGDRRIDILKADRPADYKLKIGEQVIIQELTPDEAYDINVQINMQRKNYSLKAECKIVQHYKDNELTQEEITRKCGRSKRWVKDRLHILKQSEEEQIRYFSGELAIRDIRHSKKGHVTPSEEPEEKPLPEYDPGTVMQKKGKPYIIDEEAKKEFLELSPSSELVVERAAGSQIYIEVDWACDVSQKVFEQYLEERKEKQVVAEVDLKKFNRSIVTPADHSLIEHVHGWDVTRVDVSTEKPRGMKVIIWHDLEAKKDYDTWDDDRRIELIKQHKTDLISLIPFAVFDSYPEDKRKDGILELTKEKNNFYQIVWRSGSAQKKFHNWLKKQLGSIPLTTYITDSWEFRDTLDKFEGKYVKEKVTWDDMFLFWKKEKDWLDFKDIFTDKTKIKLQVTKQELECLKKHKPEQMKNVKTRKKGDIWTISSVDSKTIDPLKTYLTTSRSFKITGLESIPTALFKKYAIEELPIPLDVYTKAFEVEADLDYFFETIQKINKEKSVSVKQIKDLKEIFWDLNSYNTEHTIQLEKERRKGKHRLKICQDCLQDKHMDEDQVICSNCIAITEHPHLNNAAAASPGGGSK